MIKIFLSVVLLTCGPWASSQEKFTLNGYVKDAANGEELIGVSVYIPELKAGTVSNSYGFYSLTLPKGTYDVQFSYLGYTLEKLSIVLEGDIENNIELKAEAEVIEEVVISERAIDENVVSLQMSKNTLDMNQVRKLPALFGEVDIIKNIQMLPGVITAGEGTSSFYVRGGSADQNLILIDEAPIYDPSHLFGLFSVFNADVVKDSELYKGGIPARFGGMLSSILDVRTKDGNNKEFHGSGGVGSMAARMMVEGPLKKEKSSYIISARRSYVDVFLKMAGQDNLVNFYDVNAKFNWKADNNNRLFAAFYSGRDAFKFGNDFGFTWGNTTGTLRWNHLFSDRLFSNLSVIASNFDYELELQDPTQGFKWTSSLQELSVKYDLAYFINTNNELTFGYHVTGRRFSPGLIAPNSEASIFEEVELQHMFALDHAFYVSNQQRINDNLSLDYGVRLSIFQNVGPYDQYLYEDPQNNIDIVRSDTLQYGSWENIKTYVNLEPRVGIRYIIGQGQSVKLSYNRMVQNTHLIAAGTVPVPFNTWNPSSYYLKPQLADQIAAGYFRNFGDNVYELSVETYYKNISNVTDFADNAEVFFNEDLPTEYRQGRSWSYGAEFLLAKREGNLTGSVGYTWSKTERKIEGVNLDRTFPANYDRRHVVNIQAAYDLSPQWSFGATFTYSTGRPTTVPTAKFEYQNYNPDVITERNGYRLPAYHRLDLSATYNKRPKPGKKWRGQWVFSVYNAYNRANPFTIYTRTTKNDDGDVIGDGRTKEARMIYLFPILPSITYNFKF